MQCIIMENTLIKLTHHDETKKRAQVWYLIVSISRFFFFSSTTRQQSEGQPYPKPHNPMTLKCDFTLHSLGMGSAHKLTERKIWVKFNEIHPKGSENMERTQNS